MEEQNELEPIIAAAQSRCMTAFLSFLRCIKALKWLIFVIFLVLQLIGLVLVLTWALDCFLTELHTTVNCVHFDLFRSPKWFEIAWLFCTSVCCVFLIWHIIYRSPQFCGVGSVLHCLKKKKYFYKILFVLIVVIVYDIYVMADNPHVWKYISYTLFIMDKFLTVVFVFLLNFLPRFLNPGESIVKRWLFKFPLVVFVIQNFSLGLLGSVIAAYKVLNDPSPAETWDHRPSTISVISLILLITNNGYRFFVADFFFSKIFEDELDILSGGLKSIEESLGRPRNHEEEVELNH